MSKAKARRKIRSRSLVGPLNSQRILFDLFPHVPLVISPRLNGGLRIYSPRLPGFTVATRKPAHRFGLPAYGPMDLEKKNTIWIFLGLSWTLYVKKAGTKLETSTSACTWKMGFNAPMAKLATFKGINLSERPRAKNANSSFRDFPRHIWDELTSLSGETRQQKLGLILLEAKRWKNGELQWVADLSKEIIRSDT